MATPKFFRNTNKSSQQLIKDLEERLKLNKGSGMMFAEDTGYQPRSVLPGYFNISDPSGYQQQIAPRMPVVPQYEPEPMPEFQSPFTQDSGEVMGMSDNPSVEEFLGLFTQSLYAPQQQSSEYLEKLYQVTGTPYGIASQADGSILLNTGKSVSSENAYPIASMMDGRILFSDGSTRTLAPQIAEQLGGVEGLSQGLFGRQQRVTQEYGNYNPDLYGRYGGTRNIGVDFRTKDLENRTIVFPVNAEIVDIRADDGQNPYGNSVLVRLPSGEMLRLSHLATLPNVRPGQVVPAGQLSLTPGATGNVTGEHLDVEYYNPQGQLDNPQNFTGFTDPIQYLEDNQPQQSMSQKPVSETNLGQNFSQETQPQPLPQLPQDPISSITAPAARAVATQLQPDSPVRATAGGFIEQAGQRAGIPELGMSENMQFGPEAGAQARLESAKANQNAYNPYLQLLGNVSERVGDIFGIPESNFSEALAGNPTKRTNVALADEIGSVRPDEIPGIRQNISDIAQDVGARAGQGLDSLKRGVSGVISGVRTNVNVNDLAPKKVVGGEAGAAPAGISQISRAGGNVDNRDPFFKDGQSKQFSQFLSPDAGDRGAVDLQAFNEQFFTDPSRVQSVFGGSAYLSPAMQKYEAYAAEQRRIQAEQEARAYEEQLRSQLRGRGLDDGQIRDFIAQGRVYDPVTQSSSGPGGGWSSGPNQNYSPANANYTSSRGVASYAPPPRTTTQSTPRSGISSGPRQNFTPANANYTSSRGVASYAPPPKPSVSKPNIFQQAIKTISNIFRR